MRRRAQQTPRRWLPLSRCPPAWVREVGQTLIARHTGLATDDKDAAPGLRSTSFGGVFLLLPLLDELPLAEATHGWPHADEAAAITLVRALLLVKCCGRERARRAFDDPLLRDLLLLPPAITPEVLADWQAGISAANVQTFVETLAGWHSARGAVQGEQLILARIAAPGAPHSGFDRRGARDLAVRYALAATQTGTSHRRVAELSGTH